MGLLSDFTILGRITRNYWLLATGGNSQIEEYTELYRADLTPVLGVTNLKTDMNVTMAVIGNLLQMDYNVVSGLKGTRGRVLATTRGDVDLLLGSAGSLYPYIESGELKSLLVVSDAPLTNFPLLESTPFLGGLQGVAADRARELGMDVSENVKIADSLENFASAGRIIVAPPNLPDDLKSCLQSTVYEALQSEKFSQEVGNTKMTLDIADGEESGIHIGNAVVGLDHFHPSVEIRINDFFNSQ